MEYATIKDLYRSLIPVFNVKQRILKYSHYEDITNIDIFKYLIITKWKNSHDLTICEVVNDIINLDARNIVKLKGTK